MNTTRPTSKSESVCNITCKAYEAAIKEAFPAQANEDKFMSHVILAVMESSDSYQAVRYINDFYEWPCSRSTITLFDNIFYDIKNQVHTQILSWVVSTGIRPNLKKGEPITFSVNPDVHISGHVAEVLPATARYAVTVPKTGTDEYVTMMADVENVLTS